MPLVLLSLLGCEPESAWCGDEAYVPRGAVVASGLECTGSVLPYLCLEEVCDGPRAITCESMEDFEPWVRLHCRGCRGDFLSDGTFYAYCREVDGVAR